jgi:hypothetical protein
MPPQMDAGRNGKYTFLVEKINKFWNLGLRMTSPGTRLPPNPIGHPGPGGPPPPNAYRPSGMPPAMSPSMNQPPTRMYMTNSPGVNSIKY